MEYDVVIIGAGAAGLMCAIEAGKRGRKTLLLDHAKSVGEKIRISGGGRCNFTNIHASKDNFLSNNPHFCVSALSRYTQHDFIELVEKYDIDYHEKTLGQLFCDGSSKQIIDMLISECESADVTIKVHSKVIDVAKDDTVFNINIEGEDKIISSSLVIATGGPSIPKMGGTGWGYEIAEQFNLDMVEPRAALVPFTRDGKTLEKAQQLSGISVDNVIATCNDKSFKEALLFTHRGLSGPVILQISSYWKDGDVVTINLAPDHDVLSMLKMFRQENPKQEVLKFLSTLLPKRLAQYICDEYSYNGRIAEMSNQALQDITDSICNWQLIPDGTEGYRTAEVTLGGVNTDELSSKTFETKKVSGLFFIGEVVDVTGHLGGFNFQWAWSSGFASGQYV